MVRKIKELDRIDKVVGNRISQLRMALGMSRQDLADKIGVTHQQAHKYEKGINRISAGRLFAIARALNKPVEFFFENLAESTGDSNADVPTETEQQRLVIQVAQNFKNIRNPEHKKAVNDLIRKLANDISEAQ